ncbi:MAG: hypothetical protein PF508_14245 [Spirochaeta sp.]|jgi:hypothetical protein|nr:hypothetical protein [Spirochaeta sp.]
MIAPQRARLIALSALLLLLCVVPALFSQVYPRHEMLDVVTLTDGTILKGLITETVPDRYVEIELYGGSVFVLGFPQIESIEEQPNPDYAPTWIKVDLAAIRAGEEQRTASTETDLPSLRDGGVTLGVYVAAGPGWFSGPDWDDALTDNAEQGTALNMGFGLSVRATGQPAAFADTMWMLGFRGGVGYQQREGAFFAEDPFGVGDLEYEEWTDVANIPLEVLIGGAGERFALYGGFGPGVAVLTYGPDYEANFKGTGEFDETDTYDTDTSVSIIATASLNAVFRLGRSWEADLRVAYERLLIPWDSNREVYHNAIDFALGVGYRF